MPCGCQGAANTAGLPAPNPPVSASRIAVYEVMQDGKVSLSTTSPSAARQEARRLGASIRVTSRPIKDDEPVPV